MVRYPGVIFSRGGKKTFAVRVVEVRFGTTRAWVSQPKILQTGSWFSALAAMIKGRHLNQHAALSPALKSLFCGDGV